MMQIKKKDFLSTCGQKHLSKTYPLILIRMASLKITVFKAKALKDGRHKIRIAVCHKQETCYIVTRFIIDSLSQFKNGQVVKRQDAAMINTKLRNLLNLYQERLDDIKNLSLYSCKQIKNMIQKRCIDSCIRRENKQSYFFFLCAGDTNTTWKCYQNTIRNICMIAIFCFCYDIYLALNDVV